MSGLKAERPDGWRKFLSPIVDRYKDLEKKLYLRGDAAFAIPDIYEYLEGKGVLYAPSGSRRTTTCTGR